MEIPTEEELLLLDEKLANIDLDVAVSMGYVRKAQGWSFSTLSERFAGVNTQLLQRYMQQGYACVRPIHFIAAYSWVTMVPMTSFYKGLKIRESYRGMDETGVEALICIANMPYDLFSLTLQCIHCFLDEFGKKQVDILKKRLEHEYGVFNEALYQFCSAPPIIDIDKFAASYYRSIALTVTEFRKRHQLSPMTMARVLGLSEYKYRILEDPDNPQPFSMAIGLRVKLGFKLNGHVQFTHCMKDYPEFHEYRKLQHIRDSLLIESLRYIPEQQKPYVIGVIKGLSAVHSQRKK